MNYRQRLNSKAHLILLAVCTSTLANAAPADFVQSEAYNPDHFDFDLWDPSQGDVKKNRNRCAASADDNSNSPPGTAQNFPYQFKATGANGFYIYLGGDNSLTSSEQRLPINIRHKDRRDKTSFEVLTNDVYDSHFHSGQFNDCLAAPNPGTYKNGRNSRIQVRISENDIYALRAGDYSETFTATVLGGSSGTATASTSTLVVAIEIPEMIRVAGLDNINLGNWTGAGLLSGESEFCVYANTPSYSITLTTANPLGNAFRLKETTSSEFINYTAMFDDDLNADGSGALDSGIINPGYTGNLGVNVKDCVGGSENASIYIEISESNLRSSISGDYNDTLTVRVEPN